MTAQLPSKARLEERIRAEIELLEISLKNGGSDSPHNDEELLEVFRFALAAHEQEPVAYIAFYESGSTHGVCQKDDTVKMEWLKRGFSVQPLFTHPAPSIPAAVPEEATPEMQAAGAAAIRFETTPINKLFTANAVWRAMRAAMLNHQSSNQASTAADVGGEIKQQASNDDTRRMDWLVSKTVNVREPMVYGSHDLFWSQTISEDWEEEHKTTLREQIDAAMPAAPKV